MLVCDLQGKAPIEVSVQVLLQHQKNQQISDVKEKLNCNLRLLSHLHAATAGQHRKLGKYGTQQYNTYSGVLNTQYY